MLTITRYEVQAKRKDTTEPWSDWARCNNYRRAEEHANKVEELGYYARIVVREKQIKKLWGILGNMGVSGITELADAIFDAGFRQQSEVAKEIFAEIDKIFCAYEYLIEKESGFLSKFAELKKKYTEVSENENQT